MLPVIPADKANHFVYGSIVSAVSIMISYMFLGPKFVHNDVMLIMAIIGIFSAVVIGIAKEINDLRINRLAIAAGQSAHHGVEIKDAIYTAVGGVFPAIPVLLVHLIEKLAV